jgi:translin
VPGGAGALDQGDVDSVEGELRRLEEAREELLKEGRDAMLAIRRAVASVHAGDERRSAEKLDEARGILREMKGRAESDLLKYVLPVEAEYVEASAFHDIAFGGTVRSAGELGADPRAYILGLLDALGECRRLVYDRVREGRDEEARRIFEVMDDIYSKTSHLAIYDRVAGGLKRKMDAAKVILDDAVRVLTEAGMKRNC